MVYKFRRITLNYNTSQYVTFEVINDMVLEIPEKVHVCEQREKKIKRKRKVGGGVVSKITEPEFKLYRISFFKRRHLDDNTSVLFWYK